MSRSPKFRPTTKKISKPPSSAPSNSASTTSKPPAAMAPPKCNLAASCRNSRDFRKTFETSMKYLGLDYVDLLSLHGVNHRGHLHDSLKMDGCLAEARKLQKEGRCRFVGFSTHATTDIILDAVRAGDFDYM